MGASMGLLTAGSLCHRSHWPNQL